MAYRLPNRVINVGVIHSYWATANSCPTDRFMMDYNYPNAWGNCRGDGGSVGGKPQHRQTCSERGRFPEEFWGCSDVRVNPSSGGSIEPRAPAPFNQNNEPDYTANAGGGGSGSGGQDYTANTGGGGGGAVVEDGQCDRNGSPCSPGGRRCCASNFVCGMRSGSSTNRCISPNEVVAASAPKYGQASAPASMPNNGNSYNGNNDCVADGDLCNGKRCCSGDAQCLRVRGDGKFGEVCHRRYGR